MSVDSCNICMELYCSHCERGEDCVECGEERCESCDTSSCPECCETVCEGCLPKHLADCPTDEDEEEI